MQLPRVALHQKDKTLLKKGTSLNYQERLRTNLSWYKEKFQERKLVTADGRALRFSFQKRAPCRAAVLVVNGRTEYIEKYIELLRDLQIDGVSWAIYDHYGQGDSGRMLDDPEKGHIDRFDRYVDDLHLVVESARKLFAGVPIHLLCHSMGGTIAWLYSAREAGGIESLILSAPMFSIRTGIGIPQFMVESVARICCRNGMADRYVATTGPFNGDLAFADNELTSDPDRFAYNLTLAAGISYARTGGPTYRWLCEAFGAMRRAGQLSTHITCPVLFLAGSEDQVVGIEQIEQMSGSVDGDYRLYENARHELLMEAADTRNRVLDEVRRIVQG